MVRIYGAYNLVVYGTHFRFFVMENLFYVRQPQAPLAIHERCDFPAPNTPARIDLRTHLEFLCFSVEALCG